MKKRENKKSKTLQTMIMPMTYGKEEGDNARSFPMCDLGSKEREKSLSGVLSAAEAERGGGRQRKEEKERERKDRERQS